MLISDYLVRRQSLRSSLRVFARCVSLTMFGFFSLMDLLSTHKNPPTRTTLSCFLTMTTTTVIAVWVSGLGTLGVEEAV